MQQPKRKNWFVRHKILSGVLGILVLIVVIASATSGSGKGTGGTTVAAATGATGGTSPSSSTAPSATTAPAASTTTTTAPTTTTTVPHRVVTGKRTTLGAGNFAVGQDIPAGLYDVTAAAGQSGNFIVNGADSYDEILGTAEGMGIPKVRVQLRSGDKIQISGLSSVVFSPVTTPYVTTVKTVDLYAGTWFVGKDLAPGRYVATPGHGQSGNFIIDAEGVDEILGTADGMGVPNVTVTVHKGDVIQVSGLSTVVMTPKP